jgi:chromate transporter
MGSLPQIRQDLVVTYRVLSDQELSHGVVIGRSTPGPMGVYVVVVGYLAAGWPGAVAGWLAMVTPALVAVPLLVAVRRWLHLPRIRSAVDAVVVASAVLLVPASFLLIAEAFRQLQALL